MRKVRDVWELKSRFDRAFAIFESLVVDRLQFIEQIGRQFLVPDFRLPQKLCSGCGGRFLKEDRSISWTSGPV